MTQKKTCRWCQNEFETENPNRDICRRTGCREKQIHQNVSALLETLDFLKRHVETGRVEIRCPGNDDFGAQIKMTITTTEGTDGLQAYFGAVLRNRIRGNFVVDIRTGTIQTEMFLPIDSPAVFLGDRIVKKVNRP